MPKYKVYISSTFLDLKPIRQAILDRIHYKFSEYFEFTEVMEKMWKGENRPPLDVCLENVRGADIYILLIGKRYGSSPQEYKTKDGNIIKNDGKSYTWLEYKTACEISVVKKYKIYNIELTDKFFANEKMDPQSDLDKNATGLNSFLEDIKRRGGIERIENLEMLGKCINDVLSNAQFLFNNVITLISSEDQINLINRNNQIIALEANPDFRYQTRVASIIINTNNITEDAYESFSSRLEKVLEPQNERCQKIAWFDINQFSDVQNKPDMINQILIKCSENILGSKAPFLKLEKLGEKIKNNTTIKTRFLGFLIDLRSDIYDEDFMGAYTKNIKTFLGELNKILTDNEFDFNFFPIIYIISEEKISDDFLNDFTTGMNTEFCFLGRMDKVEVVDIKNWLKKYILTSKNDAYKDDFTEKEDEIIKLIFNDIAVRPKYYNECIEDINSKIVKPQ